MPRVLVCAILLCLQLATGRDLRSQTLSSNELKDLMPGQLSWLLEFAGKPVSAATGDPRFRALRDGPLSILKAKFDLGDPPGGKTLVRDEILSALNGVPDSVETRLGRYVVLSGCRETACADRAFVWIDTVQGVVLAVLAIPSSSDLPGTTPQIVIASRQLDVKRLEITQLPQKFWSDWQEWAFERHLPPVMTERVVNTYGGVSVVFHDDEQICVDAMTTMSELECGQHAVDAATADLNALLAQMREKLGSDSQGGKDLDAAQKLWSEYETRTCQAVGELFAGGTYAPVAETDCYRSLTHERVRLLNRLYFMPLYD